VKVSRKSILRLSAALLYMLIAGCSPSLVDPTGPDSSLIIGRVVIENQWMGELTKLPLGTIEKGLVVEIKSKDGNEFFELTTDHGGYFFVSNIPHNSYYINKVIFSGRHVTTTRQFEEAYSIAIRGHVFTPVSGKVLDVGGYALNISRDGGIAGRYINANPEGGKSHLLTGYPNSPWLKRAFVSNP
jgi:hypothetical protein